MIESTTTVTVLLALFGLVGGVGITAVGPGGVLPTIGLFALTDAAPAEVAGTAIVTHVATGVVGTVAYTRSGQLREHRTRRTALVLAGAAVVGTPTGVLVNGMVSESAFGVVLAGFMVWVAVLVWHRERRASAATDPPAGSRVHRARSTPVLAGVGFVVAAASGVVGVGGPMLAVPLLVALGFPVLTSLAAAQVQSVVVAGTGTVGYVLDGSVDWSLATVIGLPELVGVLVGWRVARALPARRLKLALVVVLLALAPYLALHG
ncbi:hypothetical protein CLV30_12425 [Haloactinopolyspora alba]|uniref:Probable membrane transporter protein n=1 Tax=Haloactinopolyspora alba TaxID=648780 RepID=A0A2P8DIC8_9ACTN|nr:sulfite exporter TauE/SafE family protein [Haloactinopolyspora alba]PSK96941.1 hypothetical protein CLV30_12425 [Haloactinopolyspora alba]